MSVDTMHAQRTAAPSTDGSSRDRSMGDLAAELGSDMSLLVRKEIELAKIEIKDDVRQAGKAGGMLGAGAFCGYFSLLLMSFAAAWGLAEIIEPGWAFLILGVVYAIAALALSSMGRKKMKKIDPVPNQTVETVKEDVQWARRQTK